MSNRRNLLWLILITIIVVIMGLGGWFYWENLRGSGPAFQPAAGDIAESITNQTDLPLKLPPGFSIDIFAEDLPGVRVMARDGFGNWWVSQPDAGTISLLELQDDGSVKAVYPIFRNLNSPHGLAFDPELGFTLYFAEENKVSRVAVYSEDRPTKIMDLPSGAGHSTRTLGFGPDGRLYISIGSSCNVCVENDQRRSALYSLKPDGTDQRVVARGLRNAVFFTWHPKDQRLWATEMGRDLLGDDIPPEEINIIAPGSDYGWPYCYGNKVPDTQFDESAADRCQSTSAPVVELPAHSAPLGLAFIPTEGWPPQYQHDLIVAYHGSWNRSQPTGYKLVRVKLDEQGRHIGTEDFITGWLTPDGTALGRPVDVVTADGKLYVTDDKAGVIYRITAPQS